MVISSGKYSIIEAGNALTFDEVKEAYEGMRSELDDDSDMFPNGRDHDAEDEDGV